MNPYALDGPGFLAFFVILLVALTVAAGVVRSMLRGPSDDRFPPTLDSYQAAFLAGGYQVAAQAAIVALTARGSLRLDPGGRLVAVEPKPPWMHPVEDAVWTAASLAASSTSPVGAGASWLAARLEQRVARQGLSAAQVDTFRRVEQALQTAAQPRAGAQPAALVRTARPALDAVRNDLRRLGLIVSDAQAVNVRTVPALVVLVAAVVGGLRLALGMAAGRPVGYLIGLLVVTLVVALLFFRPSAPRTHRGDRLVRSLRRTNAALRTSAAAAAAGLAGADLALAVGLWGTGVLSGTPLDDVRRVLQPQTGSGSGDSGGGSSDGGSSCGGSSCGGGCGGGCGG
jgi:ABC-type multidrug transport system fused ATPase/permease subunit